MTGLQLAALGGILITAGLVGLAWRAIPAEPDLADALDRLSSTPTPVRSAVHAGDRNERVGWWAMRHLPTQWLRGAPVQDLAILRMPAARLYGDKLTSALLGLIAVPFLSALALALQYPVPWPIPVAGSLAAAVGLWFAPDLTVRRQAAQARSEFAGALGTFVELVAMERQAGSGARQALETAATVGDNWVFARIAEELARSGWSGQPPWDALTALADELGLPALADLADIMRLSGEEGAQVYATLRARTTALRTQQRTDAHAAANSAAEKMTLPSLLMGMVFVIILVGPSLAALLTTP